jgi:hypothetical protein
MLLNQTFESIATELGASHGWKERIVIDACPFFEPDIEHLDDLLPYRRAALLAPLAFASDVRSGSGHDVAAAQVDNLRYSEPCLESHTENRVIATPGPCGSIWRGQERVHLRAVKKLHGSPHIAFARHRQDLLTMK